MERTYTIFKQTQKSYSLVLFPSKIPIPITGTWFDEGVAGIVIGIPGSQRSIPRLQRATVKTITGFIRERYG